MDTDLAVSTGTDPTGTDPAPAVDGAARRRTADARRLLRSSPDFGRLWAAYAISTVGSEVTVLAMPLAAAVLLGASPLQMGLLTAAGTAPYVGFALVVGAWVDRLRRRRPLMIAADLVAAVALLTVPVAWACSGVLTVAPAPRGRAGHRRLPGHVPAHLQRAPARRGPRRAR